MSTGSPTARVTRIFSGTGLAALFVSVALSCAPDSASSKVLKLDTIKTLDEAFSTAIQGYGGDPKLILFDDNGEIWRANRVGMPGQKTQEGFEGSVAAGELTRHFINALILESAARDRIDIHKPISAYIPADRKLPDGIAGISMASLVYESSGWVESPSPLVSQDAGLEEIAGMLVAAKPHSPSGSVRTQSSLAQDLACLAFEARAGKPYYRSLNTGIFRSLGSRSSGYLWSPDKKATPKFYNSDMSQIEPGTARTALFKNRSMSLKSTLPDLACFYSDLLAGLSGKGKAVSQANATANFVTGIPGQLERQGFESAASWNLGLRELRGLGQIAWAEARMLTQRTIVVLVLDKRIGVIVNDPVYSSWSILALRKLATGVLQSYAKVELGLEVTPQQLATPQIIPKEYLPKAGLYASPVGLAKLQTGKDRITLEMNGGYTEFARDESFRYLPVSPAELSSLDFTETSAMVVGVDNGAKFTLGVVPQQASLKWPSLNPLIVKDPRDTAESWSVQTVDNHWTITGNDARSWLLMPDEAGGATALCEPYNALYGRTLTMDTEGKLVLSESGNP